MLIYPGPTCSAISRGVSLTHFHRSDGSELQNCCELGPSVEPAQAWLWLGWPFGKPTESGKKKTAAEMPLFLDGPG